MRLVSYLLALICICNLVSAQDSEISNQGVNETYIEKPTLTFYYAPWCYSCHKVINFLKRINKQIPLKDIENPLNKEELVSIVGKRQIPCLLINDRALYESNAIIAWLSSHQNFLEDIE